MLDIAIDDLTDPAVIALLESHVAELRSISPPESTHALDLAGLRAAGVTFFAARSDGEVVGCVALADLSPGQVELKSMRTATAARGRGVGAAMLRHALAHASMLGMSSVWLETGSEDFFAPARRLYARHGFVECPPFGSYRPDPLSVFMTLPLAPTTTPRASRPEPS